LVAAALAVEAAAKVGVAKAALLVKTSVQAELGGVTRLRGVGKRGAKIGVRYDITKTARTPSATVRMVGPAHLLERDTRAHPIAPKGTKVLHLANGQFVARVEDHPGTRGKHPFEHGVDKSAPLVPRVMFQEQIASLRKVF
jgi:hypothetical protein